MSNAKNLKMVTAIGETILAVPLYGGAIILSMFWTPLIIMFVLHIVTLIACNGEKNAPKGGNISGIIASILGFVPILGMSLHILSAILLWIDYSKMTKK